MPTVLAQSNLPKSAAVVVSSEAIILRDPNNSILKKYTSDEQKELSLKSYGIKPDTMLSPGENKTKPKEDIVVLHQWLQNDGNAYIDTGINPRTSYKFEFSMIYVSGGGANLYGARTLVDSDNQVFNKFYGFINPSGVNNIFYRLIWTQQNNNYLDVSAPNNQFVNIIIDKGDVFADGVSKGTITGFSPEVEINIPIFLFGYNNDSSPVLRGSIKLAYFKIYDENGNLLRDFAPATKGEDVGLYDKVSKKLFLNKNDEGSFIAGDEIASFGLGSINPNNINFDADTNGVEGLYE